MARACFQGLRNRFSRSVLPERAVRPVCAPRPEVWPRERLWRGGVQRGMDLGGSTPTSTSVCARPLRVQDGAAVGWERGVWGQPLVLESWALLVSRGGRGGFRTRRYPSLDEQWGTGVLERGSWRARDQAGLESSSGFWEECQGQEIVGNDAQFSEEGSWSLLRLPEGSTAQPGVSTSGLEAPPPRPVLGLSLCGHRVSQSHGLPFTQVFVLLSDQPGGQ